MKSNLELKRDCEKGHRPTAPLQTSDHVSFRPLIAWRVTSHARRLRMLLTALDTSHTIENMHIPGFRLHPLKGSDKGRWSVWINGNWRLTFEFQGGDAYVLDYEDYH